MKTRSSQAILTHVKAAGFITAVLFIATPESSDGQFPKSVLLTNAIRWLSGDHEGTLMVPWPP